MPDSKILHAGKPVDLSELKPALDRLKAKVEQAQAGQGLAKYPRLGIMAKAAIIAAVTNGHFPTLRRLIEAQAQREEETIRKRMIRSMFKTEEGHREYLKEQAVTRAGIRIR